MNDLVANALLSRDAVPVDQAVCRLDLLIDDPVLVQELLAHPEGAERSEYALTALRIGVLALKQAQGRLDADVVRGEGERLLSALEQRLAVHQSTVQEQLTTTLRDYFDPTSGRFNERVEQLVKSGGDLERLLRTQIGQSDSELAKTLGAYIGEHSPLMKVLSPNESQGILQAISGCVTESLDSQRKNILTEFSLDNPTGALARLVRELKDKHGELTRDLQGKVDEVIGEFSLDKEDSALSRLVTQVRTAQERISSEFSLDQDSSALARMKRELEHLIEKHNKANEDFREHVRVSLAALQARKEEAQKSTRHGLEFEKALVQFVVEDAQASGDVATPCGDTTGLIKNCKVGDAVLALGPERVCAGARIVVEAKQQAGYRLADALAEIEQGRKNRDAGVGVFVFSRRTAPAGLDALARYGSDIVVVWDAEDAASDVVLSAALSLARALCVRGEAKQAQIDVDFERITKAILEVEKQSQGLDEIRRSAQTIRSSADKIDERARIVGDCLAKSAAALEREMGAVRDYFDADGGDAS